VITVLKVLLLATGVNIQHQLSSHKDEKTVSSKCKVLTNILNKDEDIRKEALVTNEDGEATKHTGEAKDIYVIQPG